MKQMVSEILTDSRDLHGLFEESAFQKEQKKWQFTVWYTQYATCRSRPPRNSQRWKRIGEDRVSYSLDCIFCRFSKD